MNSEAYKLLEMMKQLAPDQSVRPDDHPLVRVYQTRYMAKLMVVLAEEQEKASEKMEQLTTRLITQTDALVKFTQGLYWFTAAMLVLALVQLSVAFVWHR